MSTRLELKIAARQLYRAYVNTEMAEDPDAEDAALISITNEVAMRCGGWYTNWTAGLTADTADYCAPELYKDKSILVKDSASQWRPLVIYTEAEMDELTAGMWRNFGTADPPQAAVTQGLNRVTLYPTPSTTRASALRFTGYAIPGKYWVYSAGSPVAITDADSCPLPEWMQECIPDGLGAEMCKIFSHLPAAAARYPLLKGDFDKKVQMANSLAATKYKTAAYAGTVRGRRGYARLGRVW